MRRSCPGRLSRGGCDPRAGEPVHRVCSFETGDKLYGRERAREAGGPRRRVGDLWEVRCLSHRRPEQLTLACMAGGL